MRIKLGIDLGTSNVVTAYMKGDQLYLYNWVRIARGSRLPAFVQLRANKVVVGEGARRAWERGRADCYRRFKMRIGEEDSRLPISAEQLMTHLVEQVKRNIVGSDTRISEISGIESVVVTVPHRWTGKQRQATRAAVLEAGLPVARLVSEPIAAAAYYAHVQKLTKPEIVLVCDMGGGTFDVTLTEIQVRGRSKVVISNGGKSCKKRKRRSAAPYTRLRRRLHPKGMIIQLLRVSWLVMRRRSYVNGKKRSREQSRRLRVDKGR